MKLLAISIIFFLSACSNYQRTHYYPDMYIGDKENKVLVNAENKTISPDSDKFNDMACMERNQFDSLVIMMKMSCNGND